MERDKDQNKFSKLMYSMAGIFDSKEKPSALKIELYFKALEDLTIEEIEESVIVIMRNRVYPNMPLPAHIRQNLKTEDALWAWLSVERCANGGLKPDNPIITMIINDISGGYNRLNELTIDQSVKVQKEFERRYNHYNQHKKQGKLMKPKEEILRLK